MSVKKILKDIGNTVKTIDNTVRDINRNVLGFYDGSGATLEILLSLPIESYCFEDTARFQLQRHMMMNLYQRNSILSSLTDVTGISNVVSNDVAVYDYSYTEGMNYLNEYQKLDAKGTATRVGIRNDNIQNYGNGSQKRFSNSVYGGLMNVYPDDNDSGIDNFTNEEKWDYYYPNKNRNSILKKTKDLFRCRKVNTIISRFHTDADNLDLYDNTESATNAYGLSHGRNLLTYDAERRGISYARNGYDNPYCRVWTHHHQYSQQRSRMIRPFTDGNNTQIHDWKKGFDKLLTYDALDDYYKKITKVDKDGKQEEYYEKQTNNQPTTWGWKMNNEGWKYSVLDKETGLVNIAPKYLDGEAKNVHPKDCMFSIENLAWQGYDPYSFERALSWEQRGPFGGRIMWFPPYGLSFSEDTSVNWNEHTFIGRGESVFTYTNTARSGTLEFMMVVDHPSIIDYATWHNDERLKDTDILRFFAGCDSMDSSDPSSLLSHVKPTPLTDEYKQKIVDDEKTTVTEHTKPGTVSNPAPEPIEETPDEPIEISFYVFYPNNYSGYFDRIKSDNKVDPISYLLCGNGAQWKANDNEPKNSQVLPISFKDIGDDSLSQTGNGYEMKSSRSVEDVQNRDKNYVIGTDGGSSQNSYIPNLNKKWYYRIDGEYVNGLTKEEVKNTFAQSVPTNSRIDKGTYNLNSSIDKVKGAFQQEEADNENLYSLAEIAYALAANGETENQNQKRIAQNTDGLSMDNDRIKQLLEYFDVDGTYKVIKLRGVGYSSSHDTNDKKITYNNKKTELNEARNEFLAIERCETACTWFIDNYKGDGVEITDKKHTANQPVGSEDESGLTPKKWRSAKITLVIKKNETKKADEVNQKNDGETISVETYNGLSEEDKAKYEVSNYVDSGISDDVYITVEEYEALTEDEKGNYVISGYKLKENEEKADLQEDGYKRFDSFVETGRKEMINGKERELFTCILDDNIPDKNGRLWYYDKEESVMRLRDPKKIALPRSNYGSNNGVNNTVNENNSLRYDQEYHFFKQLEKAHPDVFNSLVEKVRYFDPAFHAVTPESFMGRLNFLQQCTRQGDTRGASEENGHTANNLAFGRPPFCILRIGDFYYQKIVIKNINITYDPLVLDLNQEGIGVVPLIANVTISFNFIGGGDLTGPVRRLQNALSFNYYANGRLYDNRADRVEYKTGKDTMKKEGIDFENSYFHKVKMSE